MGQENRNYQCIGVGRGKGKPIKYMALWGKKMRNPNPKVRMGEDRHRKENGSNARARNGERKETKRKPRCSSRGTG